MTYIRPKMYKMMTNHIHGDKFKKTRDFAGYVESDVPPIPDPEEEQTSVQKILDSSLKIIGLSITSLTVGGYVSVNSRSEIEREDRQENLPKYYERLNQKLSELMDVLDYSKHSIWLATYMIEKGAPGCPLAVSAFEENLEKPELNP